MTPEEKKAWAEALLREKYQELGRLPMKKDFDDVACSQIKAYLGPWAPWQMFAMGIIGFLAGILFRKGLLRRSRGSLATFGAFSTVVIYGGIMNPAAALMYNAQSINGKMLLAYYVSGLPMDLIHAAATVIFLLLAAEPMLEKLDRIKVKYGLVE